MSGVCFVIGQNLSLCLRSWYQVNEEEFKRAYKIITYYEELKHVRYDAFKRDYILTTYTKQGDMAGVATYKIYKVNNSKAYGNKGDMQLKQIAVNPKYKGKGYAVTMLLTLKEFAIMNKCPNIVLSVRKENKRARQVYEKFGFKEVREIMWKLKGKDLPGIIYKFKVDLNGERKTQVGN